MELESEGDGVGGKPTISVTDVDLNWCEYCPASGQQGSLRSLKETLPAGFSYVCCHQETIGTIPRVEIRIDVKDETSAKEWLGEYQDTSLATWRTARTYPNRGSRTLCRLEKRCQHMTCPRSESANKRKGSKNTNCPAVLILMVRRTEFKHHNGKDRVCRSEDHHLPKWPMTVVLKHEHNHPLKAASVLRHRDVSKMVRKKLIQLFRAGHSASSALNMHHYDLQMDHGDNYVLLCEDRHHTPDLNFTWRLYNKIFGKASSNDRRSKRLKMMSEMEGDSAPGKISKEKKAFSVAANPEMVTWLREKIDKYNVDNGDCIRMRTEDDHLVIAVVTPLMKRTHALVKYAGEMVFMDTSGSMSRHGSQVFLMMTPSFAGGLPLGVFITTSDSPTHLTSALQLGQEILGDVAFCGRGPTGPQVFFTDDLDVERQALRTVYPNSLRILSVYQVLQAFWWHLFDPKVKNLQEDGHYLFQLMKTMLYASTEAEIKAAYDSVIADPLVEKCTSLKGIYHKLYDRRGDWALCYWSTSIFLKGNNNASNYCESAMRILKDKILHRAKTYNVLQLVDFLLSRLDPYYQKRLLDVGNNRLDGALGSRYISAARPSGCLTKDQIIQESAMVFLVPHEKPTENHYHVDMTVGLCTCRIGSTGGPCSHQKAVLTGVYIPSWNFIPVNDTATSKLLFQIAGQAQEDVEDEICLDNRKRSRKDLELGDLDQVLSEDDTSFDEGKVSGQDVVHLKPQKAHHQKQVLDDLDAFVDRLKKDYMKSPSVYGDALEDFVFQTKKFKTETELICALYSFGE